MSKQKQFIFLMVLEMLMQAKSRSCGERGTRSFLGKRRMAIASNHGKKSHFLEEIVVFQCRDPAGPGGCRNEDSWDILGVFSAAAPAHVPCPLTLHMD